MKSYKKYDLIPWLFGRFLEFQTKKSSMTFPWFPWFPTSHPGNIYWLFSIKSLFIYFSIFKQTNEWNSGNIIFFIILKNWGKHTNVAKKFKFTFFKSTRNLLEKEIALLCAIYVTCIIGIGCIQLLEQTSTN